MANIDTVLRYHDDTKHRFRRYARGPGMLDWANQPDPFRRYAGAPVIELPLIDKDTSPPYSALFAGSVPSQPANDRTMAALLECSLGLSAWKAHGSSRWALRCNPSSGNLHPTEGYVVCGAINGVGDEPAVYHYAPREHALEARCVLSQSEWAALVSRLPEESFLVGLSSIHWREAWKYGERAYRYCQHDVGHALAALAYSAAALGWHVRLCDTWSDDSIARLLGLDRREDFADAEREHPDLLAVVSPGGPVVDVLRLPDPQVAATLAPKRWTGRANRLSASHVEWQIIDEVAEACRKPQTPPTDAPRSQHPGVQSSPAPCDVPAWTLFKQRRSAVAMDGETTIPAAAFYHMLARTMPATNLPPFSAFPAAPAAHLLLFVHRVEGIPPGLYCLPRDPASIPTLRQAMRREWLWEKPTGCPEDLPLHHLQPGDAREAAQTLSCGQDIASDGAFSLGMLCRFDDTLTRLGPWAYRRLFWETGMIGQVLYLEAEAAGLNGTGIGCFFDDEVHEVAGLDGHAFQSLYHFTVGRAVVDKRLTTLPPYNR